MWEISNEELRQILSGDFRFLDCKGLGDKLHLGEDL